MQLRTNRDQSPVLPTPNASRKLHCTFTFWLAAWLTDDEMEYDESEDEDGSENEIASKLQQEAMRDQAFINNLNYLLPEEGEGSNAQISVVDSSEGDPKGFLSFMRDGVKHYAKKASLLWAMTAEGKRVSTDRVYRFVGDYEKFKNDAKLLLGDFVLVNFNSKHQLVQILGFRFLDGKTFYGDFYLINGKETNKKASKNDVDASREVSALCSFFNHDNGIVTAVNHAPRIINLKFLIRKVFFKRDIPTGELKIIE